jgi:acetyl-CoA decarbonylase/synthase, CODH/ACS complex subunit delta
MAFTAPVETYSKKIVEVKIGEGDGAVTVGGESTFPLYTFEGEVPHKPLIAMEVYDNDPVDWPDAAKAPFADVLADPVAWALKCEKEYGADLICLQLAGTDPNGDNKSADEAADLVKRMLDAISVPLIVYGTDNAEKDSEVLQKVAAAAAGKRIAIGPATEDNYKTVAAAAMGFDHSVIALSPCDVNLAKQLNILLTQLGMPKERIIIDPSTGALGYGLDYTYTIIERLKLAALQQGDEMTGMPVIGNLGIEVWKTKEAKTGDTPEWGAQETRAVAWEMATAIALATAGANLLVMRHPRAVAGLKKSLESFFK